MLEIRNLNIYLQADVRQLIKDFNLQIKMGDKVALIGEEGNGKSTLLKAIVEKEKLEKYADIKGDILCDEVIAYLPQQLEKAELEETTFKYFEKNISLEMLDYNKAYKLIKNFSLNDYLFEEDRKLLSLSGGERIKFLLLVELLKDPSILILDEPSNDLDISAKEWLIKFLKDLDIALIFVSHDRELLESVADTIVHFEQIKNKKEPCISVEKVDYRTYVENRIRRTEVQNSRARKEKAELDAKYERFNKVYNSVRHAQDQTVRNPRVAKNLKDKMRSIKSQEKRLEKEQSNMTKRVDEEKSILIKFKNIDVAKEKYILDFSLKELKVENRILLQDVQVYLKSQEKLAIIGDNGCGKTTLLKEIVRELELKKVKATYMPQNYLEIIASYTSPLEFLNQSGDVEERKFAEIVLASLNFTRDEMFHSIDNLSGGQKAKIFFAKMMMQETEVLILDEPTRNLSIKSIEEIEEALVNFPGAIIFISHDKVFVDNVADSIYQIENKRLKKIK
ncbi:MAG: ATP-binding cassette domain-containing protein [Gemella sp.]|nr:ATP-binding cassette domain-containing protein [Gemella sp.]